MKAADNKDTIGALLILLFALWYLAQAINIPPDPSAGATFFAPSTLPMILAIATIVFATLQLGISLVVSTADSIDSKDSRLSAAVSGFRWRPMGLLSVLMGIYTIGFPLLGFTLGSFLFLLCGFLILGERRIGVSLMIAGALVAFLWFMLDQVFGLYLDQGELLRIILARVNNNA